MTHFNIVRSMPSVFGWKTTSDTFSVCSWHMWERLTFHGLKYWLYEKVRRISGTSGYSRLTRFFYFNWMADFKWAWAHNIIQLLMNSFFVQFGRNFQNIIICHTTLVMKPALFTKKWNAINQLLKTKKYGWGFSLPTQWLLIISKLDRLSRVEAKQKTKLDKKDVLFQMKYDRPYPVALCEVIFPLLLHPQSDWPLPFCARTTYISFYYSRFEGSVVMI